MKDINCIACGTPNLVTPNESFECGECGELNTPDDEESRFMKAVGKIFYLGFAILLAYIIKACIGL